MTTTIDEAKLEAFMGQLAGYMTGATVCLGIWLGDRLGLFQALSGTGPPTADQLAERTNCHPRLVREWLNAQAAGAVLTYDGTTDTYELSAEVALAVADEDSPAFTARGLSVLNSLFIDAEKAAETFRGNGALAGAITTITCSTAPSGSSARAIASGLPSWIHALDGVADVARMRAAAIADVGCGHGASVVVLAQALPGRDRSRASTSTHPSVADRGGARSRGRRRGPDVVRGGATPRATTAATT